MNDDSVLNLFPSSADMIEWHQIDIPAESDIEKKGNGIIASEYGIRKMFIAKYNNEHTELVFKVYDAGKSYYAYSLARRISSPDSQHNRILRYFINQKSAVFYKENYVIELDAVISYESFSSDCSKVSEFLNERVKEQPLPGIISSMISGEEYPVFYPETGSSISNVRNVFSMTYGFDENKRNISYIISDDIVQSSALFDRLLVMMKGAVLTESDKNRIFYIKDNNEYSVFVNYSIFNVIVKNSRTPGEGRTHALIIVKKLEQCYKEKY
ncbi:MAG TPA: hypothetical protein PKK43_06560 [Spirochaetota bacterium]|nr:hypothetical protein [Spirochaetota bacterium]